VFFRNTTFFGGNGGGGRKEITGGQKRGMGVFTLYGGKKRSCDKVASAIFVKANLSANKPRKSERKNAATTTVLATNKNAVQKKKNRKPVKTF